MKKSERAEIIRRFLDHLYPQPEIPLDHVDPYSLLVAVVLSAQCTDKMVNRVMPALMNLASTPAKMAQQRVEEIQSIIRPCGLSPRKAAAIRQLSEILTQRYAGQVPESLEELEKLPGVGHKTASVVMCQAFGQPAFPVDTHIHRLAQRWKLTNGRSVVQTERDLKALFPQASWSKLHLQIIYYGREHCTTRGCDGTRCELCRLLFPGRRRGVATKK